MIREKIFTNSDFIDPKIIFKIKELSKTIETLINNNKTLEKYFYIWKRVGGRISDEDYTSSRQQVKKKNPTEDILKKIYSIEVIIALILRSFTAKIILTLNSSDFKDLNSIKQYFNRSRETIINFLFREDFYDIWTLDYSVEESYKIDQIIGNFLPVILRLLGNESPHQIFLSIHQKILDLDSRKILGEIYTPPEISKIISHWVYHYVESKDTVMDLSCGVGVLLSDFIEKCKKMKETQQIKEVVGIDINPLSTLICKFNLIYDVLENLQKNKIREPLIFCADSLISYRSLRNSEDGIEFKIEFIGNNYDINIRFPDKNLIQFRKILIYEIDKDLNNDPSKVRLPDHLKTLIESNPLDKYLKSLLIERICAVSALNSKYAVVLGNPPYLRVQSIQPMWRREILKQKFESSFGHFDIYYLFIELGINLLSENGILGYVSSNKFMSTSAGYHIRDYISKNTTIKNLIDFNDSHIFGAMVLPAIYVLGKRITDEKFFLTNMKRVKSEKYIKIAADEFLNLIMTPKEIKGIYAVDSKHPIKADKFKANQPQENEEWNFLPERSSKILNAIKNRSTINFGTICRKINVGIKTTANYAFIDDYDRDFINKKQVKEERYRILEKYGTDIFFPIIKGKMIRDFKINLKNENDSKNYIFYPHYKKDDKILPIPKEDLPYMLNWLKEVGYYKRLSSREYIKKAKREWYEIWNTRDPDDMKTKLKIVVPDISPKNNFAIDYGKNFVSGSAYYILLENDEIENYHYILGILNSYLIEFYYKITSGNVLYARRYRYWSSNLEKIPIILKSKVPKHLIDGLIDMVKKLERSYSQELEMKLNNYVFKIFDIDKESQEDIKRWVINNRKGK
jgi:hypothetical protein